MPVSIRFLLFASTLLVVAGCVPGPAEERGAQRSSGPAAVPVASTPDTAGSTPPIRTDRRSYAPLVEIPSGLRFVRVVATYTNRSADTVYVAPLDATPNRYGLDRWIGGRWVQVWRPISTLDPSNPTVVPPGSTLSDTLRVPAPEGHRVRASGEGRRGIYRLRYTIHRWWRPDDTRGPLLPEAERVSNTFTITE